MNTFTFLLTLGLAATGSLALPVSKNKRDTTFFNEKTYYNQNGCYGCSKDVHFSSNFGTSGGHVGGHPGGFGGFSGGLGGHFGGRGFGYQKRHVDAPPVPHGVEDGHVAARVAVDGVVFPRSKRSYDDPKVGNVGETDETKVKRSSKDEDAPDAEVENFGEEGQTMYKRSADEQDAAAVETLEDVLAQGEPQLDKKFAEDDEEFDLPIATL